MFSTSFYHQMFPMINYIIFSFNIQFLRNITIQVINETFYARTIYDILAIIKNSLDKVSIIKIYLLLHIYSFYL